MKLDQKSVIKVLVCILAVVILYLLNPFGFVWKHNLVLAGLLLTIFLWSADVFAKRYVSFFLLAVLLILGESRPEEVFRFPLSPDFVLIVFSFLFSQGIVNAKLAHLFSSVVMERFGRSPLKLVLLGILCSVALIFIVPQPFARVILLAAMYQEYFKKNKVDGRIAETVIFSLFVFATASYMLFSNGDIILNNAAVSFANLEISFGEWMQMMFVPALITGFLMFGVFVFVFRKELFQLPFHVEVQAGKEELTVQARRTLWIVGIVVLCWLSEDFHKVGADIVIVAGTLAMYLNKVVERRDLKHINIDLLCFLTAAFAIGPVMKNTGIAGAVFQGLTGLFPSEFSAWYLLIIVVSTMALHMVLGSTITTLSVVMPGLLALSEGMVSPAIIMFSAYIAVNIHYILPFHHVSIMIGSGKKYYTNRTVLKFGLYLTAVALFSIMAVFYPYWRAIGKV